jgi:hypothetical protein
MLEKDGQVIYYIWYKDQEEKLVVLNFSRQEAVWGCKEDLAPPSRLLASSQCQNILLMDQITLQPYEAFII